MDPIFVQIIDCGSIPLWKSISSIIWHMESIPEVGGAWGEIEVMLPEKKEDGSDISFVESILQRGQYVEYKLSHYMDKAAESLFGFVSVLPGAFSTFRWKCIQGRPLNEFLKGSKDEFGDVSKIMSCSNANKYLAEDRIMWLEIIAKQGEEYILHYVPGAKCLTDPPLTFTGLLKQRRRWFNGSMFASFHVLLNMWRIWKRNKWSFWRNLLYMILYVFMILQMVLSFVIVGLFYGWFSIFTRTIIKIENWDNLFFKTNEIENIYLIFLFIVVIYSTTASMYWTEAYIQVIISIIMGLFTLFMVIWSYFYAMQSQFALLSVSFLLVNALSYILPLIMNVSRLKVCDYLKGILYNIYLTPTYINLFTIYAISNIDDVTWGSRPSVRYSKMNDLEKLKETKYSNFRSKFLIIWAIANISVGFTIASRDQNLQYFIMFGIGSIFLAILLIKLALAS